MVMKTGREWLLVEFQAAGPQRAKLCDPKCDSVCVWGGMGRGKGPVIDFITDASSCDTCRAVWRMV